MTSYTKHITTLLLLISLLMLSLSAFSQSRAEKEFSKFNYAEAIRLAEGEIAKNSNDTLHLKIAAFSYRKIRNFTKAEWYFNALFNATKNYEYLIEIGQIQKINGKPNESRESFTTYLNKNPKSLIVKVLLNGLDKIEAIAKTETKYTIQSLENLNSPNSEFAPYIYKNQLIFTSDQVYDFVNDKSFGWNKKPFTAILAAEVSDSILGISNPKQFDKEFISDFHVGPIAFNKTQTIAYFNQIELVETNTGKEYKVKIYKAIFNGKRWKTSGVLIGSGNEYNYLHPFVDTSSNTLYFSSDLPSGKGGLDIYKINLNTEGRLDLINLGDKINTSENEVFPSYYYKTFYFASDRHGGFGALDIYAFNKDSLGAMPHNMGPQINSSLDNFSICFKNPNQGFFTTEKPNEVGNDDLYAFSRIIPENELFAEISGVFELNKIGADGIKLYLYDDNNELIDSTITNSAGAFNFTKLDRYKTYLVKLSEDDFVEAANGIIYILDDKNNKVLAVNANNKGAFEFRSIPISEYSSLSQLYAEDPNAFTPAVNAQIFKKIPGDINTKLQLLVLNENDDVIFKLETDSTGTFYLKKLVNLDYKNLRIQGDTQNYKYVLYDVSNMVVSGGKTLNNTFKTNKYNLSKNIYLEPIESANNYIDLKGRAQHKITELPLAYTPVLLIDSTRKPLQIVNSNAQGEFIFNKVNPYKKYEVIPLSKALESGNIAIYILDGPKGKEALVIKENASFLFRAIDYISKETILQEQYNDDSELFIVQGQLYRKLPGDITSFVKMNAYDEDGNMIETVVSDKYGNFNFSKLPPDKKILFELENNEDLTVEVFSGSNQRIKLENGILDLTQSQLSDSILKYNKEYTSVEGVFKYNTIPTEGVRIYLLDEKDDIIAYTYSDKNGEFIFRHLPIDKNYIISYSDDNLDTELVEIYTYSNPIKKAKYIKVGKEPTFTYKKLQDQGSKIDLIKETGSNTYALKGVFEYKQLPLEAVQVGLYDENDNLISLVYTNEKGIFEFRNLPTDVGFTIKLMDGTEFMPEEANLFILNEFNQLTNELPSNPKGEFNINNTNVSDNPKETLVQNIGDKHLVFFEFDSYALNAAADSIIKKIAASSINKPEIKIIVNSYTDPTGNINYNLLLSKKRTRAVVRKLVELGVNETALNGFWFGESKVESHCPKTDKKCLEKEYAKNRKSEIIVTIQ